MRPRALRSHSTQDSKTPSFEPPPLFQVYPQALKEGKLEVSSISVDTLNKARSKNSGKHGNPDQDDKTSGEARRTSTPKHIPGGTTAAVELPKKIFVLVTSGYLLQYSESGLSDRLPEKVLHLGKDSAAFACDLVPGKHYVLQVSQAVDSNGIIVANSGSILARLGLQSAAAKRMASSLLLVMPDAAEMESWMLAIKREIESLGGKKVQKAGRVGAQSNVPELPQLSKTLSHRYQIKRHPSMISSMPPSPNPDPTLASFPSGIVDDDRSDTATIDDIELEAAKLDNHEEWPQLVSQASFEFPEIVPPPLVIVGQPQHGAEQNISTDTTMASSSDQERETTASTAPDDEGNASMQAIPTSQTTPTASSEDSMTADLPASEAQSQGGIRKAAPPPLSLNSWALKRADSPLVAESPVLPHMPSLPRRNPKRVTNSFSEPDLQATMIKRTRHDSKLPPYLPQPLLAEGGVSRSPDNALESAASTGLALPQIINTGNSVVKANQPGKVRKVASFSVPLRINPSAIQGSPHGGNVRRHSRMDESPNRNSGLAVHALTPPEEPAAVPHDTGAQSTPLSTSPPVRLSLFPSKESSLPPPGLVKRTSFVTAQQSTTAPDSSNSGSMRRPMSLQAGSGHPPHLSSARNSVGASIPPATGATVPIRSMKPSRSASNLEALSYRQSQLLAFKALKFDTPTLAEEAEDAEGEKADVSMPLPIEHHTHVSSVHSSRRNSSARRSTRSRTSLADLDLNIAMAKFGPPAPPPQAPLPDPPPASRSDSPIRMHRKSGSVGSLKGLGISVS